MAGKPGKMGQVDFTSHKVNIPASKEAVFHFLSNVNNFQKMMPEQVVNWQSTRDDCEFDIKGMAHISLVKSREIPGEKVEIISRPGNPIELKLVADIDGSGPDATLATITLTAHLSPILQMMASSPLQNLVNIMAEKLRNVEF
jgi:carbon monoxide dehydrogenase subunit G